MSESKKATKKDDPMDVDALSKGSGKGKRKAARPKEGGGQAAPPAREGRESSTTEREEEVPPLN